jgi:hypothetical protein
MSNDFTPTPPATPIIINPDPTVGQMATIARYLAILIGGASGIAGLVSRHDIAGLVAYLQSNALVSFLGAALALGTAAYGLYEKLHTQKKLIKMEPFVPDTVAQLKGAS